MTETDLTIDRPIKGDVNKFDRKSTAQKGPQEFVEAIDRILAVPGVGAVRWRQYTPYFNDGEPCEFGVEDLYVRLGEYNPDSEWDEDDEDADGGDYDDGFSDAWGLKYYSDKGGAAIPEGLLEALNAYNADAFEDVARENFGEHATVTATKAGFEVEYYEHD